MKILYVIEQIIIYFLHLPAKEKILWITSLILIFSAINIIIISPVVFNYVIIPKIEKKLGTKLKFKTIYDFFLFGNFSYRFLEVAIYIFLRYFFLKINPNYVWKYKNTALAKVNYDVRNASRLEIAMSFYSIISMILGGMSMLVFWILTH